MAFACLLQYQDRFIQCPKFRTDGHLNYTHISSPRKRTPQYLTGKDNDKHFERTRIRIHGQLKLKTVHWPWREREHGVNWRDIDGAYTAE